jgi:hypothetical protein
VEVLGDYALIHLLSADYWKRVWFARSLGDPEAAPVAFKIWQPAALDEIGPRMFDLLQAHRVEHPDLAPARAAEIDWLAQDFVEGVGLPLWLGREGGVEPGLGARVASAGAGVLDAVYGARGDHVRLRPSSFRVGWDGAVTVVELEQWPAFSDPPMIGDLRWSPPELVRQRPWEERSEVWRLGSIIFELVEGRPPFEGSQEARLTATTRGPHPRMTRGPEGFIELMARATAERPGDRPKLQELRAEVEPFLALAPEVPPAKERAEQERLLDELWSASLPHPVGTHEMVNERHARRLIERLREEGLAALRRHVGMNEYVLTEQAHAEALALMSGFEPDHARAVTERWVAPTDRDGELEWMTLHFTQPQRPEPGVETHLEVNRWVADLADGVVEREVIARGHEMPRALRPTLDDVRGINRHPAGPPEPPTNPPDSSGAPADGRGPLRRLLGRLFGR